MSGNHLPSRPGRSNRADAPAAVHPFSAAGVPLPDAAPTEAPRPSLADVVAAEAEASSRRRVDAGRLSHEAGARIDAATLGERMQAEMLREAHDAIQAIKRRWPDLWTRLIAQAQRLHVKPAPHFFAVVAAGLDAMEGGE